MLLLLSACGRDSDQPAQTAGVGDPDRGRAIYVTNCTACHHSNPAREGSTGPAIKGSSRELLEAKVLKGTYPAAYPPRRDTKSMPLMPYLASRIPDLEAYLNSGS